jgi:PAS domain S-box-containing protein
VVEAYPAERQDRERGLGRLAELARLDDQTGSIQEVSARALEIACDMFGADRAAVCAIEGDETVEWLAQRRLEPLIAASSDLRPSQLPWMRGPLETGKPELFDRRLPEHRRSPLSGAADALGMAAFAIVPLRAGQAPSGELGGVLGLCWSDDPPGLAHDDEFVTTVGRLIGLALGNIRLRDTLVARQHELDDSEARYRSLFDQAPQAILICDWDGRVLDANAAALTSFGFSRHQIARQSLETLTDLGRDELRQVMNRLERTRRDSLATSGRRTGGDTFPISIQLAVTSFRGEERVLVQLDPGVQLPGEARG